MLMFNWFKSWKACNIVFFQNLCNVKKLRKVKMHSHKNQNKNISWLVCCRHRQMKIASLPMPNEMHLIAQVVDSEIFQARQCYSAQCIWEKALPLLNSRKSYNKNNSWIAVMLFLKFNEVFLGCLFPSLMDTSMYAQH